MPNVDLAALYAAFESRPFPGYWEHGKHGHLNVHSNPDGHAIVLVESEDFYDDHDGSAAWAAHDRLKPQYIEYRTAAAVLWGEARMADVVPRLARGEESPLTELLIECGEAKMEFWTPGERAIGVAFSQMDKEEPIQVVALVVPPAKLFAP